MNEAIHHENVTQLFLAACELPEEERNAFLGRHCADDPGLIADVEIMLREDSRNPHFLETPALGDGFDVEPAGVVASSGQPPQPMPSRIGTFKVLEVLGEGGMGIVYLAEQDNPRRRVAIKVVRPGIGSENVLKRFEHESHILARLQHVGIAQVFDAGLADTKSGRRPYFAMEYVKGVPLTEYAEAHGLGTRDRLMLMQKVCDAVHHAHQKGVIHRDLKPGNILVDESGQPKVLDFGVARATDSDVQATTMRTDVGQLIGTISYMSPEQIEGDPDALDTRSDVYALGVICYKLLTGRLPHELGNKLIHEAARVICDNDPTPMSSVNRIFRGDVETIVHKALEKDRERRYQAASDLGADMERYVRDEPIVARPASAAYQLRKFARRNRAFVVALMAVFMALVIGVTATSWALVQANRQRNHAEANLQRAMNAEELAQQRLRETKAAITEETRLRELAEQRYKDADAARSAERRKQRDAIAHVKNNLHEALEGKSALEASICHAIGADLRHLGDRESADPFLVSAVELRRQEFGNEDENTLESLAELANLRADQTIGNSGETPEERERLRELNGEATRLFREVYETSARTLGPENSLTVARRGDVAVMLPPAEAEPLVRENLEILRRTLGPTHKSTVSANRNLAYTLLGLGRIPEAIVEYKVVLAVREKQYPPEHELLLSVVGDLSHCFEKLGDYRSAIEFKRRYVSGIRKTRGDEDFRSLMHWQDLARLLQKAGRYARDAGNTKSASELFEEAGQIYTNVLERRRASLGSRHGNTLFTISMLGQLRQDQRDYSAAETLFKELIPSSETTLPEEHWHRAYFKSNYANLLIDMKRFENAESILLFAYPRLLKLKGADFKHTRRALERLVTVYERSGKVEKADRYRAILSRKPSE